MNERLFVLFPNELNLKLIEDAKKEQMQVVSQEDFDLALKFVIEFIKETNVEKNLKRSKEESLEEHKKWVQLLIESKSLFFWINEKGEKSSLAGINGRTQNGYRIALVFTPKELRSKGYATKLVAMLCKHLFEEKNMKFLCLNTDLSNPISNSIYSKIGFKKALDMDQYAYTIKM